MNSLFRWSSILLVATAVFAQSPQFEVASVRPSAPLSGLQPQVNVGLRIDGQQARLTSFSLRDYIAWAYKMKPYNVAGPDWMNQARFDVVGTMPPGVKPDQISDLLQGLLAERFGLKFHREQREMPVFALSRGKGPLLLKLVPPDPAAPVERDSVAAGGTGTAAGVSVNLGNGAGYTFGNNKWEGKKLTIPEMAEQLERYLDRPIADQSGLEGRYDVTIEVSQEDGIAMSIRSGMGVGIVMPPQAMRLLEGNTMSSLFAAFEKLGLKLEAKKLAQDMIVVDSALKMPTEN